MIIERAQIGRYAVLHLKGRMDAESSPQFRHDCEVCISEGAKGLVVDVGDLNYISSMGVGNFVAVGDMLKKHGGELRICRLSGLVRQVFQMTSLDRIFPPYESVESALAKG